MGKDRMQPQQPHLKIYSDHSEYVDSSGAAKTFSEGEQSAHAARRYAKIRKSLEDGGLATMIENALTPGECEVELPADQERLIAELVHSVTSDAGRAIVGLMVLQLYVKYIEPSQSIRLHKSGRGDFSWVDGIAMRALDKPYITPELRRFNLLKLNADGFMMTRSLAENYPYTSLYKAAMKGGKGQWLSIIDLAESGALDAGKALTRLIQLLSNRSKAFMDSACAAIESIKSILSKSQDRPMSPDLLRSLSMRRHIRLEFSKLHSIVFSRYWRTRGFWRGILSPYRKCDLRIKSMVISVMLK